MAWIAAGTSAGLAITAAIPPVFDAYATVVAPEGGADQQRHNRAMLALLDGQQARQPWWLGYLSTSADHLILPGTTMAALPKVRLYADWEYVLVEAGPRQAATWRRKPADTLPWWNDVLPDLMFPADRSWLVSRLCDDDWTCLGGPASLVASFLATNGDAALASKQAWASLSATLSNQAYVLAFADAFVIVSSVLAVSALLVLMLPQLHPTTDSAAAKTAAPPALTNSAASSESRQ